MKSTQTAQAIKTYLTSRFPFEPDASHRIILRRFSKVLQKLNPNLDPTKKFYCYVYLDPRYPGRYEYVLPSGKVVRFEGGRPFYVGKGQGERWHDHIRDASGVGKTRNYKLSIIQKILERGWLPLVRRTRNKESEALALALEVDLIAGIGRRDFNRGPLANHTDGCDGVSGMILSLRDRAKRSALRKGVPLSPYHKARQREGASSPECRLQKRLSHLGKVHPQETKDKMRDLAFIREAKKRALRKGNVNIKGVGLFN